MNNKLMLWDIVGEYKRSIGTTKAESVLKSNSSFRGPLLSNWRDKTNTRFKFGDRSVEVFWLQVKNRRYAAIVAREYCPYRFRGAGGGKQVAAGTLRSCEHDVRRVLAEQSLHRTALGNVSEWSGGRVAIDVAHFFWLYSRVS